MSKWEWKKLGEVYDFTRGLTYSKKDEVESSSNCILRSNNIDLQTNSINLDELKYIKDEIDIPQEKYVRKNTILICMSNGSKAHLGKVAYIDKDYDFAFGGFMGLLKPKCEINGKFVHLYLCSDEYKNFIKSLSDGANINNLKFDDLRKFEIPFPPLSEQNRIVKFLDEEFSKIETLKTNAETNLKNAKELFETTLEKELNPPSRHSERSEESSAELPSGWEWKALDEFSTNLDAKRKPVTKKNRVNGNYPYYGASGIVDYVDSYIYDGKYLLISEDGANLVARSTPIAFIAEGQFWVNNHAHIIETANEATLQYLVYFFENLDLSPYVKGMAQPKLSQDSLYKIPIPLPPLSVQKEIVARLDKLSENVKRLEANYKQIIADCDELKKSILKKTFERES